MPIRFLLSGHDTIEVCYYLRPGPDCQIDFFELGIQKEELRQLKRRNPKIITLGGVEAWSSLPPWPAFQGHPPERGLSNSIRTLAVGWSRYHDGMAGTREGRS